MLHARITVTPILGEIVVQARIFTSADDGTSTEIARAERHYRSTDAAERGDEFHALMLALRKFSAWATLK